MKVKKLIIMEGENACYEKIVDSVKR